MKIFVGGINGVGKTTTLTKAAEILGMKHVRGSSMLMEYFGFPGDYEKLRSLLVSDQDNAWAECAEKLLAGDFGESFLLDAHYLSLARGKINTRVDDWINGFDALVLISAPINDIWNRVVSDHSHRDRDLFPDGISEDEKKEFIIEHEKMTREEFRKRLKSSGKSGVEIENRDGEQGEAVSKLVEFVKSIS